MIYIIRNISKTFPHDHFNIILNGEIIFKFYAPFKPSFISVSILSYSGEELKEFVQHSLILFLSSITVIILYAKLEAYISPHCKCPWIFIQNMFSCIYIITCRFYSVKNCDWSQKHVTYEHIFDILGTLKYLSFGR